MTTMGPPQEAKQSWVVALAATIPVVLFRATSGGMPILIGLFIAHQWGLSQLGLYTVANALIAIALVVADWGASRALPRNLAVLSAGEAATLLASSNAVRFLLVGLMGVVGVAAVLVGLIARDVGSYLNILFLLCPLWVVATNAVSERIVVRQMGGLAVAVVAGLGVFGVLSAFVVRADGGPRMLVAAYVCGKTVEVIILARRRWWVLSTAFVEVWATAKALLPFSAQMVLAVLYSRAAVFTVEKMTTRTDLGVFSAAVALQGALLLIPASLSLVYFPELTRLSHLRDHLRVQSVLRRYAFVSTAAVGLGVMLLVMSSFALTTYLGVPVAKVPFVLTFSALAFLSIFTTMAGFLLQARGEERVVARLSAVTLSLSLCYQLIALHFWGLWGIAAAIAAAEVSTAAIFGVAVRASRASAHRPS